MEIFKATPHCVKNKSHTGSRYSSAFFFDMSFDAIVSPIVGEGQIKKFEETHWGNYLMERLTKNYVRK